MTGMDNGAMCVCLFDYVFLLSLFSAVETEKNGGVLDGLVGWNGLGLPLGLGLGWLLGWLGHGVLIYPCADVSTPLHFHFFSVVVSLYLLHSDRLLRRGLTTASG